MSKRKAFVNFVKAESILFMVLVTVFAVLIRAKFFPYESSDYHQFLQGWFSMLRENGGLAAVGLNFGDYTPPYYYLLALLTYLPFRDLYLIKALSCVGDIVLASYVFRLVDLKYNEFWGEIAYAVTLLLPSVVLNSAVWAQCDSIYTAALAACVYYLMIGRETRAAVAFSISFAFKLQAVFLAPLLLLLLLKRKIRLRSVLILPLTYLIAILPSALAGRNFWDLLTVYIGQTKEYNQLTMNLPNFFTWFPLNHTSETVGTLAVYATGALVLLTIICLCSQKFQFTNEILISLALFYVILVPYFLPYMHERYYYPADIFSVVFAFYFPEKFYIPIITVLASTYSMCRFLFGVHFINMKIFSVLMLFCMVWIGIQLIFRIRGKGKKETGGEWEV